MIKSKKIRPFDASVKFAAEMLETSNGFEMVKPVDHRYGDFVLTEQMQTYGSSSSIAFNTKNCTWLLLVMVLTGNNTARRVSVLIFVSVLQVNRLCDTKILAPEA